jgi:2,4-dienoyl-CoA reductase-like NADH-dependent reductase (Old Yellow Enzyme family)
MATLADSFARGPLALRNRLVATAHGTGLVRDGRALPGDADYWRRIADGGVAMAIVGGTCVAPESQGRSGIVLEAYREDVVPDLRARARAIKAGGAFAVQQIVHLGRETLGAPMWYHPIAPSGIRSPREAVQARPLALDEVDGVVQAFVRSAANVAEAGFDGVELHAAHGYLLAQFLSPEANTRSDRYGGDRSGRVRLLAETISGIRSLVSGLPVGVRLSVEPGLDVPELAAIVAVLADAAEPDWLNITVGPRGDYVRDMATERPPLLGEFAPIRKAAPWPLIVSHAFRERDEIDAALAQGADLVGMARPFIADADFARKLFEQRDAEIRPCVSCNEDCRLFDPALLCTVNPDLGLPGEQRRRAKPLLVQAAPARDGGPVAILGAGPAGLECAATLAEAGRADVVLFEAGDELGGALETAVRAPHRKGWQRILDYYASRLVAAGVDVRVGARAETADVAQADEIVVAIGSEEVPPELPGIELAVGTSELITAGAARLENVERVVVVDDGFGWWPGVNAVELAIAAGVAEITMLTPAGTLAVGLPHESRTQLLARLQGARLETRSFLVPTAVEAEGLVVRHRLSGDTDRVPADVVVFVGERRPVHLSTSLPESARVQMIGDAVVPRRAAHAIAEGRAAAETILASVRA